MSAVLTPPLPTVTPLVRNPIVYRWTVRQYEQMITAGVLGPADRVELIEGQVVNKMPANPPHDGTRMRVGKRLRRFLPAGWDIRTPSAITLSDSRPEPDVAVVREDADDYTTRHPLPSDTGLVVEVADTSLAQDRDEKARMYARGSVACYWIVNLPDRQIEVHTQPSGPAAAPGYAQVQIYRPGDLIPLALDGTPVGPVPAADLLP